MVGCRKLSVDKDATAKKDEEIDEETEAILAAIAAYSASEKSAE